MSHPLCYTNHMMKMKNKKTFKFTVAPSKANNMAGWTSTVQAHTKLEVITKLIPLLGRLEKIEEISG